MCEEYQKRQTSLTPRRVARQGKNDPLHLLLGHQCCSNLTESLRQDRK